MVDACSMPYIKQYLKKLQNTRKQKKFRKKISYLLQDIVT
jgi:hypothetical protein